MWKSFVGTFIVAVSSWLFYCNVASAHSGGAPIEACVRERRNSPNHAGTVPQPSDTSPYTLQASGFEYDGRGAPLK
ncbi:unnamed protein product [Cyprideis torosa]|uniref:Uncharacterized protein n=1 Tax=Cyprideis torosa TaxID=163714 RepID=A0A7R8WQU1_9CRUS|nr:unnamed protein product [Cyprideis torosa]CAG0908265.1 unnamed protein product [Cyprideis torosa]